MELKSLFRGKKNAEAAEPVTKEQPAEVMTEEKEDKDFWAINPELPVDILADYSDMLFSGKLEEYSREELVIGRIAGEMSFPVLDAGTRVLVRGYDTRMEPFSLRATVKKSTLTECEVHDLQLVVHSQRRKSVRYPLSPPADIYALTDTRLNDPQKCRLLNISTGGACIISVYSYDLGDTLKLRVKLIEKGGHTSSYPCQVVRVVLRPDGQYEYGLLFAQLKQEKMADLLRDIKTIQEEARRRVKA